jgi:hypothetical protein
LEKGGGAVRYTTIGAAAGGAVVVIMVFHFIAIPGEERQLFNIFLAMNAYKQEKLVCWKMNPRGEEERR